MKAEILLPVLTAAWTSAKPTTGANGDDGRRCLVDFVDLPSHCAARDCATWERCWTNPSNATQRCVDRADFAALVATSERHGRPCEDLACSDPFPWVPLHCPDRNCSQGSGCFHNPRMGRSVCLPHQVFWNVFGNPGGGMGSGGPKCDYFCHEAPPGVAPDCDFDCYLGTTCRTVTDDDDPLFTGLPRCVPNPLLWQDANLTGMDTSLLPYGGRVLCSDALRRYLMQKTNVDNAFDLMKADRKLLVDVPMQLIFIPIASAVLFVMTAVASCAIWALCAA